MSSRETSVYPSSSGFAVTTSDSVNFPGGPVRGLYVGTGGTLSIVDEAGNTLVLNNVANGTFIGWVLVNRVNAATTTASNIVAFY